MTEEKRVVGTTENTKAANAVAIEEEDLKPVSQAVATLVRYLSADPIVSKDKSTDATMFNFLKYDGTYPDGKPMRPVVVNYFDRERKFDELKNCAFNELVGVSLAIYQNKNKNIVYRVDRILSAKQTAALKTLFEE